MGFVFQFFNLLPTLTALENVMLTAEWASAAPVNLIPKMCCGESGWVIDGSLPRAVIRRAADNGWRWRRALAKNPALVLADEPTGSLDFTTGVEVLDVMRSLNRETGQTFVLVTHNQAIAQMADRVVRVGDGMVHAVECNAAPLEGRRQLKW